MKRAVSFLNLLPATFILASPFLIAFGGVTWIGTALVTLAKSLVVILALAFKPEYVLANPSAALSALVVGLGFVAVVALLAGGQRRVLAPTVEPPAPTVEWGAASVASRRRICLHAQCAIEDQSVTVARIWSMYPQGRRTASGPLPVTRRAPRRPTLRERAVIESWQHGPGVDDLPF